MAPTLFHSEMANTLWKYVRAGMLDKEAAMARYEEAIGLVDTFTPDADLLPEALLAAAHPVYDLLYLTLARRHGGSLLTVDRKLAALVQTSDQDLLA